MMKILFVLLVIVVVGLIHFQLSAEKYIKNELHSRVIKILCSFVVFLLTVSIIVFVVPTMDKLSFYKKYIKPESNPEYMITFSALVVMISSVASIVIEIKNFYKYKKG